MQIQQFSPASISPRFSAKRGVSKSLMKKAVTKLPGNKMGYMTEPGNDNTRYVLAITREGDIILRKQPAGVGRRIRIHPITLEVLECGDGAYETGGIVPVTPGTVAEANQILRELTRRNTHPWAISLGITDNPAHIASETQEVLQAIGAIHDAPWFKSVA